MACGRNRQKDPADYHAGRRTGCRLRDSFAFQVGGRKRADSPYGSTIAILFRRYRAVIGGRELGHKGFRRAVHEQRAARLVGGRKYFFHDPLVETHVGPAGGVREHNLRVGKCGEHGGQIVRVNVTAGTGAIDVSPAAELSGRLNLVLGSQTVTVARGTLKVSGSLKDPLLSQ